MISSLKLKDPVLECDWNILLPIINSTDERNRVKRINPNLVSASYPLTRDYLNSYFNNNKFSFSDYKSFVYDCSASMYSFFVMTFGYVPGTGGSRNLPLPAQPGGQGVSFGFNPFFGLFDVDSPILWILLILAGALVIKKITD